MSRGPSLRRAAQTALLLALCAGMSGCSLDDGAQQSPPATAAVQALATSPAPTPRARADSSGGGSATPQRIAFTATTSLTVLGIDVRVMAADQATAAVLATCARRFLSVLSPPVASSLAPYEVRVETPPAGHRLSDLQDIAASPVDAVAVGTAVDASAGAAAGTPVTDAGASRAHIAVGIAPDAVARCDSVMAHEGAHLVFDRGLSPPEISREEGLYQQAQSRRLFVSEYASTDAYEYWCESTMAYLGQGWGGDPDYQRGWLQRNDPQLIELLADAYSGA